MMLFLIPYRFFKHQQDIIIFVDWLNKDRLELDSKDRIEVPGEVKEWQLNESRVLSDKVIFIQD